MGSQGVPSLVRGLKSVQEVRRAERIAFRDTGVENWLQELLDREPSLLPLDLIDPSKFGPLTSLGREVPVETGSIDNLFLSASGRLVVVETKLWRNPEARRKAVVQILDYAGYLRKWTYARLDARFQKVTGNPTASLFETIRPVDMAEESWIDLVEENLNRGKMLLLIVGDGIRSQALSLGEVISGHSNFLFRLAFVELQLYKIADDQVVVIPSVPTRTEEIERAVVRIEYTDVKPAVEVTASPVQAGAGSPQRSMMSEDDLRARLRKLDQGDRVAGAFDTLLAQLQGSSFTLGWAQSGMTIKLPSPAAERLISLGAFTYDGSFGNHLPWIDAQIGQDVREFYAAKLMDLGATVTTKLGLNIPILSLAGKEREFIAALEDVATFVSENYAANAVGGDE